MITAHRMLTIAALLIAAGFAQAGEKTPKAPTARKVAPKPSRDAKDANHLAPLPIELPKPVIAPTPKPLPPGVKVEAPINKWRPRKPFMAPKGCVNVARGKKVAASDMEPVIGTLDMVVDGDKAGREDACVELGPGVQWVQLDLGRAECIQAIVIWHEHRLPIVYHDVIVQVADDKDFIENVRTIYNNDHDNSAGQGLGDSAGYFELYEGKLIPAKGVKARYVRLYSNGSTSDELNRYTEVEVYAVREAAQKKQPSTTTRTRASTRAGATRKGG